MSTNSRLGTPSNLPLGGLYDLLLIKFPGGFPESALKFDIDDTPRKITGVQKVAQVFLKVLFTSAGSNVLYPNQGTGFSNLTINANISTNDPVFISELAREITSAESQTKNLLNTTVNDLASQLSTISILGLDTNKEGVMLYLSLVTGAGELAQVAVPFPQLDLNLSEGV